MNNSTLKILGYLPFIIMFLIVSCKKEIETPDMKVMIRADFYVKMKNYNEALVISNRISIKYPEYDFAHFVKGQALFHLGRIDEAKESFNMVIKLNPEYPKVYLMLGNAEGKSGNYVNAISLYRKELALLTDTVNTAAEQSVYLQLGRAYSELGHADSALIALNKLVTLNPTQAEAYNDIGQVHEDMGNLQEALEARKKALELNPDGDYQYQIGVLLVNLGQYKEALPYLEKTKEVHPDFHGVYYNLGRSLVALNRHKEGEKYLAQAEIIEQKSAELGAALSKAKIINTADGWLEYAEMLRENNRYPEAMNVIKSVLSIDSENTRARELMERIRAEAIQVVNSEGIK